MKILIVDNDAFVAKSLYKLLRILHLDPYAPVDNPGDAISILASGRPQLVMLDPFLGDRGSGLLVADYMQEQRMAIPLVLLASEANMHKMQAMHSYQPLSYWVKPQLLDDPYALAGMPQEYFLKSGPKYEKVDKNDLVYVKSSGKYVELVFSFGKRLVRRSLSGFLEAHPELNLMQVHRAFAVNRDYVRSISSQAVTVNGLKVPIGRSYVAKVQGYLKGNNLE